MTAPASPTDRQPLQLNDEQRDAMTRELFTHWRSTEPDTSHCFCGDASDLVDALQTARASLRHTILGGRPAGLTVVLGIAAGCLTWATASLAGLTALLAASRLAYDAVRIAGAAYLIWLGSSAIWRSLPRHRSSSTAEDDQAIDIGSQHDAPGRWRGLRAGLVTNLLNPKVGVFYISLLPQFLPTGPDATAWGALLVAIHIATGFLWYPALILLVGPARRVLQRAAVRRWLDRITATVLIGLGLKLATDAQQ